MKISNELLLTIATLILVLMLCCSLLIFLLNSRINMLKELLMHYIDSMNLKGYMNAKTFIKTHESLPGLSEFEQAQLEGARKLVKTYEENYKAPEKN